MKDGDFWVGPAVLLEGSVYAFTDDGKIKADISGLENSPFVSNYIFATGYVRNGEVVITMAKDMPTDDFLKSRKLVHGKVQILKDETDTYVCFNTKNILEADEEESSVSVYTDSGFIKCITEDFDMSVLEKNEVVVAHTSVAPQKQGDFIVLSDCQIKSIKQLPNIQGKKKKQVRNVPVKEKDDDLVII